MSVPFITIEPQPLRTSPQGRASLNARLDMATSMLQSILEDHTKTCDYLTDLHSDVSWKPTQYDTVFRERLQAARDALADAQALEPAVALR